MSRKEIAPWAELLEQVRRDTLWLGLILLIVGTTALTFWVLGGGSYVC